MMVAKRGTAAYEKWVASPKFEQWRNNLSSSLQGRKVWNKGVKGAQSMSVETRRKMSDAHLRRWRGLSDRERAVHSKNTSRGLRDAVRDGRYSGGMLGKRHSAETKRKIRDSNMTPEVLAKHSRDHSINSISRQTTPEAMLGRLLDGCKWKYVGSRYLEDESLNPNIGLAAGLPVSADFVNRKARCIVMVDGCYWHECPEHGSGKFPDKPMRDARLTAKAQEAGWTVVRVWEHELASDTLKLVTRINRIAGTGRK